MQNSTKFFPRWSSRYVLLAMILPALVCAGEPIELARGVPPQKPQQPQVAVDSSGAIHVVYGSNNVVWYRRSSDGGQTFHPAVELPAAHVLSLGMRRGPRIAVTPHGICVSVIGGKQGKGRDGDLLAHRSVDGGKTWGGPVRVNDVADAAREGLHAMSSGPQGDLCSVWLDLRSHRTEILAATSADGGSTWSKNRLVYQSPDGSVCECCHPSVAFDRRGRIGVQWRNQLDGARDMYLAISEDGGKSFGPAAKLGTGTWNLDACPMDGGALAILSNGALATVWRREKSVYLSQTGDSRERLLGAGEQPWLTATEAGPCVVWLKKRFDVAYLVTPGSPQAVPLATQANDPVIAAGPGGRGPVVAAWESRQGNEFVIQCLRIAEHGRPK